MPNDYPTNSETLTLERHFVDAYNGKTKNTFVTGDRRRFETWDSKMAARVLPHLNRSVLLTYEIRQNGQYTNLVIKDITPLEEEAQVTNGQVEAAKPQTGRGRTSPEERTSIHRQVAAKLAVEAFAAVGIDVVAHQNEAMEYAQGWVDFFEHGWEVRPAEDQSPTTETKGE